MTRVCKAAIADAGIDIEQIGKLVVVSSTGFLGPGLDCELIKTLGLWRGVDRSLIGFMGCAAASDRCLGEDGQFIGLNTIRAGFVRLGGRSLIRLTNSMWKRANRTRDARATRDGNCAIR